MIAMGSIHEEAKLSEQRGTDQLSVDNTDIRQRYAAHHAQLALLELSKVLAARPEATEIALMNCILVTMLDFMVGNFATALIHLHNGQEILNKWRRERQMGQKFAEGSLEDNLAQILHQLSFRTSDDDIDPQVHREMGILEAMPFSDLYGARKSIDYLTKEGLRIIRMNTVTALTKQVHDEASFMDLELDLHRARLGQWLQEFECLTMKGFSSDEDNEIIEELRMMHTSTQTWLELGLSFNYPERENNLEAIINRAKESAQHPLHR
jgi:hypothetical protein